MFGYSNWNYAPYTPAMLSDEAKLPYISRLAPHISSVELQISNCEGEYTVYYSVREVNDWKSFKSSEKKLIIDSLEDETDYKVYIETKNSRSKQRLFRTGFAPGIVVNYLHPEDEIYSFSGFSLCSPSICLLPSGKILTSMDIYKSKFPQNLTVICESDDGGETWNYVCELFPCFWGKLFYHKDALYMLSTSTEYGDLLIGRSDDEGRTWSAPTVICRGSCSCGENGFHKAPVTVINTHGRLWTAVEYGSWTKLEYRNSVISIDENADLLKAENWHICDFLKHDSSWENAIEVRAGAIEGNVVEAPDGSIINMLRYAQDISLQLRMNNEKTERGLEFLRVIDFPMAHTKFEVKKIGELYFAIGNRPPKRNILSLYKSCDLVNWEFVEDILNYENLDPSEVGFNYPAFEFDGKNLLVLSRTAFNKARNFHDANYQTFHKVPVT